MSEFNHFNQRGETHMVDVGKKSITQRRAIACGEIHMQAATLDKILASGHKKGDVLGVARLAGIMAAKKTSDLIPLCHPLSLTRIELDLEPQSPDKIVCTAMVETQGQTGVEMEALTAVQIALLTIYDMCKAVDRGMSMQNVHLLEKMGGKSGHWQHTTESS